MVRVAAFMSVPIAALALTSTGNYCNWVVNVISLKSSGNFICSLTRDRFNHEVTWMFIFVDVCKTLSTLLLIHQENYTTCTKWSLWYRRRQHRHYSLLRDCSLWRRIHFHPSRRCPSRKTPQTRATTFQTQVSSVASFPEQKRSAAVHVDTPATSLP